MSHKSYKEIKSEFAQIRFLEREERERKLFQIHSAEIRKAAGLSRKEVAEKIGYNPGTIERYENQGFWMPLWVYKALVDIYTTRSMKAKRMLIEKVYIESVKDKA